MWRIKSAGRACGRGRRTFAVVLNDRREQVEGFAEALKEKVRHVVLLDTLFLASPISWKGRLTQFAGRLHRLHDGKREVRIYDYVDVNVAVCARMYDLLSAKRSHF